MKCKFCGSEMPEESRVCPHCGAPAEPESQEQNESRGSREPEKQGYHYVAPGQSGYNRQDEPGPEGQINGTPYMVFAIFTTLCCCLPLGIVSIVYAGRIQALQRAGDYEGARRAAKKAKIYAIVSAVISLFASVFYGVTMLAGGDLPEGNPVMSGLESVINGPEEAAEGETAEGEAASEEPAGKEEEKEAGAQEKEKPAAKAAEQEVSWEDGTIRINGKEVALPCTFADIEAAGLILDESYMPEGSTVNSGATRTAYFQDESGNRISAEFSNPAEEAKELEDCPAVGIAVAEYEKENDRLTVIFPGDLQVGTSTVDDLLSRYGEADNLYEGDGSDRSVYFWCGTRENGLADYDSYCQASVDVSSGTVVYMEIRNAGGA